MNNSITLNNQDFEFNESLLPCLVTGAYKSGASYFSVSLVANLIKHGTKLIFFTAFPMAKEELFNQINIWEIFEVTSKSDINKLPKDKTIIVKSGDTEIWKEVIKSIKSIQEYIIFVKNIEEYDNSILDVISKYEKILLSGSLDNCSFRNELSQKIWKSKIIFTLPNIDFKVEIPNLEKYESYLISENFKWIVRIKKMTKSVDYNYILVR